MEQLSTLTHYAQLMLYQYRILQFTEFDVVMVQQYPMIVIWIKCVLIRCSPLPSKISGVSGVILEFHACIQSQTHQTCLNLSSMVEHFLRQNCCRWLMF